MTRTSSATIDRERLATELTELQRATKGLQYQLDRADGTDSAAHL